MARAVLHVGLPKTGTSYVQQSLVQNRRGSRSDRGRGAQRPWRAQHDAAYDLLGRRIGGTDAGAVVGAWPALVDRVARLSHPSVLLAPGPVHARPRQVHPSRARSAPCSLHVVVTVRDLRRAISGPRGSRTPRTAGRSVGRDYVLAVRDPSSGPPTSGVAFWLRYDVRRILQTWSERRSRWSSSSVVAVPRAALSPHLLFERFAEAADLDPTWALLRPPPWSPGAPRRVGGPQRSPSPSLGRGAAARLTEAQHRKVAAEPVDACGLRGGRRRRAGVSLGASGKSGLRRRASS